MTDMERRIEAAIKDFFLREGPYFDEDGWVLSDDGAPVFRISDFATHIADELGRKP